MNPVIEKLGNISAIKIVDTFEKRLSEVDPLNQAKAYQNISSALQNYKTQQDAVATQVVEQKKKVENSQQTYKISLK